MQTQLQTLESLGLLYLTCVRKKTAICEPNVVLLNTHTHTHLPPRTEVYFWMWLGYNPRPSSPCFPTGLWLFLPPHPPTHPAATDDVATRWVAALSTQSRLDSCTQAEGMKGCCVWGAGETLSETPEPRSTSGGPFLSLGKSTYTRASAAAG